MNKLECNHEFTVRIVGIANHLGEYKGHYDTNHLICCDCEERIIDHALLDDVGFMNADTILKNPKLSRREIYAIWYESYEKNREKSFTDEEEYKNKQKPINDAIKELSQKNSLHYSGAKFRASNCRDLQTLELICDICKKDNEEINRLLKESSDIYYEELKKYYNPI